jgi:hypothetical protein
MAYYDALIAKWAQAPAGTNDQKLTWVNAQTVTGAAIKMIVPSSEIYNRTDRGEYDALTNIKQQPIQRNLAPVTVDYSIGSAMRALWLTSFPAGSKTQTNLAPYVASFDTPQIPWWKSAGYPAAITPNDLVLAGIIPATPVTPLPPKE